VKRRIESEDGISYTDFSYALLQAYDYVELFDRCGCTLQMGGSDQWGNIVAGIDLIRRVRGGKAHGLVQPLITTASGTKFGKTEGGTIWLDPQLTKPYEFYQFWLNTDDRDAVKYLKFFTFLPQDRIREFEELTAREPERRHAQRALAREVTLLVHGAEAVGEAEAAAIVELLSSSGVTTSKSEATRLIRSGGIYLNSRRVTDEKERVKPDQAIEGRLFVVRKGKRDNFLIRIVR
jgi:tyrosyl-tRNA synthetase